ncbi:Spc97/Spc98 family protein [Hypoxylon trugodes]|uniref:Spc97/Spc98 family protein n=1 Tax=Hypoxylon trugodes TaxID=326681 RepID=UPI002197FADA|nr:Spc97/Spc98 family protein [Hypoxylon trugodes]KAI1386165.1 Spc97/Spc98 family protein [Hypoxylon trugodes]
MADKDPADFFAFPDYEQCSKRLTLPETNLEFFRIDFRDSEISKNGLISLKSVNPHVDGFFRLPEFPASVNSNNSNGANESEQQKSPVVEPLHNVDLQEPAVFEDLWSQCHEPSKADAEYKTWDEFLIPDNAVTTPLFITEAGPGVYDAAMKELEDPLRMGSTNSSVVQTRPYIAALLSLAFGRASNLFNWNEEKASFIPKLDEMRISGYSADVLKGLQERCVECGNATRYLSAYVQTTYTKYPGPVRIAVAKAVDVALLAIQKNLGTRAREVRSLLQLQLLIQPIVSLLAYFKHLIVEISKTKTEEQILSLIFKEVQIREHGNALLNGVTRDLLSRASLPWAEFTEKWIGVKAENGLPISKTNPGNGFIKVENIAVMDDFGFEMDEPDYVLDENRMPEFVPSEVATVMFETGKTLRLLRIHHPDNPVCRMSLIAESKPPTLQWHFDWKSIEHFHQEVKEYEKRLFENLRRWSAGETTTPGLIGATENKLNRPFTLQFWGHSAAEIEERLLASIEQMNKPPALSYGEDNLMELLDTRLFEDTSIAEEAISEIPPHWSLIPYQAFEPLVAVQARVINREYMKLLFSAHQLRDHLSLQKQFQLLGNGVFCSRLSHALFDPDLDTAERQAGIALTGGTMGLRLSGRKTWPPASSELRLALMGVLAESYLSSSPEPVDSKNELPGDISFAVRDLSPEEIEKCLDPESLEALDFLRLSYKPTAPLSPIFTTVVLLKYDKIFKLLLRVLRMLYVTEQIFRDSLARTSNWHHIDNASLRFRIEAQYFITSISAYFFETGLEIPWKRFDTWLNGVETNISKSDLDHEEARVISPDGVREEHERMLDHIMHTLLLRKRQQPVMKLLEDIFTLILKFSKVARLEAIGGKGNKAQDLSPKSLYNAFKKKVDIFITVCRGLREKGSYTEKPTKDELMSDGKRGDSVKDENTIDMLLVKLEMSGYYGRVRPN